MITDYDLKGRISVKIAECYITARTVMHKEEILAVSIMPKECDDVG
jgi:hypothetical protein